MNTFKVTANFLNLRAGPNTKQPVLHQLPKNKIVERKRVSVNGRWYYVTAEVNGQDIDGWAYKLYLEETSEPRNVTNAVINLSQKNEQAEFPQIKNEGILGVVHKASEGDEHTDPKFNERRESARESGLLFGSFHRGTAGDGIRQADHYLSVATPRQDELMVLDFESATRDDMSMNLEDARLFVTRIYNKTGRMPGFYSGSYFKELRQNEPDHILKNCWLWVAHYAESPEIPPAWERWTLWQYTNGAAGPPPHEVIGAGNVGRSKFNGTEQSLRTFWESGGTAL